MSQGLLPINSVIELKNPVYNKASAYNKYFESTDGVMPVGTLFRIIRYSGISYKPYGVRLLVDGEEIMQKGGNANCYHSLEVGDYQLYKPSKLRKLLDHVRMADDI